jgi:large subunit ribosomal protein L18
MDKKSARLRRARRTRAKIRDQDRHRLTVSRSPRHIYAQIFDASGGRVLVSASTVEKTLRSEIANGGNVSAAAKVGELLATRAKEAGISSVAFDRSGYQFHGRIKALAEAAREHGLDF